MSYINVGAYVGPQRPENRPKTKKALREALAAATDVVTFDKTAIDFDGPGNLVTGDLTPGVRLQVTGPDPYRKRDWYATVELVNGKIRCS